MKFKTGVSAIMAATIVAAAMGNGLCGDASRIIKSTFCPGMGQLADGNGDITNVSTMKGLGFMAAEIVCVSLLCSEASQKDAHARETAYLEAEYRMATTYEKRNQTYSNWQSAFDKSNSANTLMLGYTGAAALVWILNVADIVWLKPKGAAGESLLIRNIKDNLALTMMNGGAAMSYRVLF
jgi:hypothetical protein